MHTVTFYPVGNGDCSQIILDNQKRLLFDFHHLNKPEISDGSYFDLKEQLLSELKEAGRDYFDVVAFTHGDEDHIKCSTDFFELLHAEKYQGEGRIKINELWVPAAMIIETARVDNQDAEFVILRQEARHRLREGKGIRVFSKPEKIKEWLDGEGLDFESRRHLFTDAGSLTPGFTLDNDGVEFFCHSPFIKHTDDGDDLRNDAALIFNIRFKVGSESYDYFAVGDTTWEVLTDIIEISKLHGNKDRLEWDLFNVPHHCSYKAISETKGDKETIPEPSIQELLKLGRLNSYMVSSSFPILETKAAYEQLQPPHIQAKNSYKKYLEENEGTKFIVTMEEPSVSGPKPMIFKFESNGIIGPKKSIISGVASIITTRPPRAAGN